MSQSRQPAEQPQDAQDRGRAIWSRLAIVVFLLPASAVLLPTAIVLAVTMLPSIVARTVDRVPGKAFTVTVGMLNAAGSAPAVIQVWSMGHNLRAAELVLGNPLFWMLAYLAAALGWTIFLMLPPIMRRYYGVVSQGRVAVLQKRQDKLRELWGEAVTGNTTAASEPSAEAKIETAAEDLTAGTTAT